MPTKIFTLIGGECPFGLGTPIDSEKCRRCEFYFRAGTGTFFWCKHPDGQKRVEIAQPKRKRGRPPGKATKKPVKRTEIKKR